MTKKIRNISLTPFVEQGKIRVVLSWPNAPRDLDLYAIFKTGKFSKCQVFFGKTVCSKTHIDVENNMVGGKGAQTITIDVLEKFIYTFAVRKFISNTKDNLALGEKRVDGAPLNSDYNYEFLPESERPDLIANATLSESNAKISIFVNGFKNSIREIIIPSNAEDNLLLDTDKNKKNYVWWLPFCLNGVQGMDSLKIINKMTAEQPKETYCESLYSTGNIAPSTSSTSIENQTIKNLFVETSSNKMKKEKNKKDYEIKIKNFS